MVLEETAQVTVPFGKPTDAPIAAERSRSRQPRRATTGPSVPVGNVAIWRRCRCLLAPDGAAPRCDR